MGRRSCHLCGCFLDTHHKTCCRSCIPFKEMIFPDGCIFFQEDNAPFPEARMVQELFWGPFSQFRGVDLIGVLGFFFKKTIRRSLNSKHFMTWRKVGKHGSVTASRLKACFTAHQCQLFRWVVATIVALTKMSMWVRGGVSAGYALPGCQQITSLSFLLISACWCLLVLKSVWQRDRGAKALKESWQRRKECQE